MSYERYDTRRRTTTYGASSRRTAFGYWVPLVLTVTVATFGVAAWIWKERRDNEEYDRKDNRPPPGYGDVGPGQTAYAPGPQVPLGPAGPSEPPGQPPFGAPRQEDPSVISRVSEVLRRTPSPQQFFDEASRRVTAGVAAAGAAVGSALSAIREEEKGDYEDHSRWSEEASGRGRDTRPIEASQPLAGRRSERRKTVAIVVSAEASHSEEGDDIGYHQEHAVSKSGDPSSDVLRC